MAYAATRRSRNGSSTTSSTSSAGRSDSISRSSRSPWCGSSSSGTPIEVIAARRVLLAGFVLGLGSSITLSEASLALLTILWLWRLRARASRRQPVWPLAVPVIVFSGVTLLSALLSGHAAASVSDSKLLLLVFALYVVADAVPDSRAADQLLSGLAVVAFVAASMGLVQVVLCPEPPPDQGLAGGFFHRRDRARAAFSIYMTLAGVLNLVVVATLPWPPPGHAFRPWSIAL